MSSTPPDIFLSYSRDDQATARKFAEGFQRAGFSVWWDVTLRSGENYDKVTEQALESAKAVVVLWSKKSVDSNWVRAEATQADRNKTLVPVTIEPCKRPIMFELKQTADLSHWKGDANDKIWLALLSDVEQFVQKEHNGVDDQPIVAIPRRKAGMKLMLAGEILLVVAIAAVVLWHYIGGSSQPESGANPASATANVITNTSAGTSLAVLPFVNLSSDTEQEYFSDGLTEELLNQLAQVKELRVTGRTSSFAYKGKNVDLRVIGEQLGVGNILEGSVRKAGNQLRITAQLIKASDGTHLWSRTYERELNDVFKIQEEIAMAVSDALSITLDVGAMSRARGGTSNIDAYDNYLRARNLDRNRGGRDDLVAAAELYRKAVALDPLFIRAWSDLHLELQSWLIYVPQRADEARAEMTKISARLLELAPQSPYSQTINAATLMNQHRWAEAAVAIDAVAAAGGDFRQDITSTDTVFLLNTGRIQDAIPNVERRLHSDPLSINASYGWQIVMHLASRPDEAQAEYKRSKTLTGDHTLMDQYQVHRLQSRRDVKPAELQAQMQTYLQHPGGPAQYERTIFAQFGNRDAMLGTLHQAFADPANQSASPMLTIAGQADWLDDTDLALAALRRSYVDYGGTNVGILWQPFRNPLHADARFKDILRDLKLVDYFRQSGKWGDFCKPVGTDDFECH